MRRWSRARRHLRRAPPTSWSRHCSAIRERAGVPVEFVARSHFPLLELDAQLELMRQLAEGVAPHV